MLNLYLKRIEMQGFKSFADKTTIEFKKDITAIVGPNGSGKSNITDAIRWVLGEQSVKSLRGSKMEDIIFSGTDKRRPLGFAEVTVVFDNRDNAIPIDYNEVAITRRMFRSGESEYYINRNSCRLRDIRELFMDTGVGKEGYSIIGQGRIDEILSNRPEDRRNIFEEAAGIVKYKTRKETAERRLEETEENLIRINDLTHEVNKQFKKLEADSKKATKFINIYEELKTLEANIYLENVKNINKQIDKLKGQLKETRDYISQEEETKEINEEKVKEIQDKIKGLESNVETLREKEISLAKEIDHKKNKISLIEEKENFNRRDINRLKEEIEELEKENLQLEESIKELKEEASLHKDNLQSTLEIYEHKNEALITINEKISNGEEIINQEKERLMKNYNQISHSKSRLQSLDTLMDGLDARLETLKKELTQYEMEEQNHSHKLKKLTEKKIGKEKALSTLREEKLKQDRDKESLAREMENLAKDIRNDEIKLRNLNSNLQLYQSMEEGYEGYYRSVKNTLLALEKNPHLRKGFIGTVADLIKVDSLYERAVEVSLGSSLQNIIVERESDAKKLIEYLKEKKLGRVTFLPKTTIKGRILDINIEIMKEYGVLGLGHQVIDFPKQYQNIFEYLLGRTIVVDNIDNAISLSNRFGYIYRLVTLEGDIINPGGSLTGGSLNKSISLISRKNRIKEFKKEIEIVTETLEEKERKNTYLTEQLEAQLKNIIQLEEKIKEEELDLLKLSNEVELLNRELINFKEQILNITEHIGRTKEEKDSYSEEKKIEELSLNRLTEESANIKINIDELSKEFEDELSLRNKLLQNVTDIRLKTNNLENSISNLEKEISSKEKETEKNKQLIENKNHAILNIEEKSGQLKKQKELLLLEISNKSKELLTVKKDLEFIIPKKEDITNKLHQKQALLEETNKLINKLEKEINSDQLKLSKLEMELEYLDSRLADSYELNYQEALKYKQDIENMKETKERVNKLKGQLKRLGNVNLTSLDEYDKVKERLDFLVEQKEDLTSSKERLEEIIIDMEKKMRTIFVKQFKEINENFREIFSILFGGGKAMLRLDEEDILGAGIEIVAQPPGKRLQNINLLSGGEKTLTAVALLFAILKTRPSPFCILDEIDAALDEANINRYTDYLKSFNQDVQFVLITHRKTTMEIADILYGVTMAEEGVSKLISVELKDYIDDMAG